jgi:ADP-heptose:LPS heptosyltransferase
LSRSDIDLAKNLIKRVKPPIVAINFGVGDNPFKRVGEDFEASLIWSLLREGASIVLDKGAGQEEGARIDAMLAEAAQIERNGRRARVVQLDGQTPAAPENPRADADVLVWNGRVGILAGLIGQSDLYIGYDSAGQHIAAALQVPCIDVFAGFSSHRMLDRWRPTGIGEIRVLPVETGAVSSTELVSKVMDYAGELLSSPHNNS